MFKGICSRGSAKLNRRHGYSCGERGSPMTRVLKSLCSDGGPMWSGSRPARGLTTKSSSTKSLGGDESHYDANVRTASRASVSMSTTPCDGSSELVDSWMCSTNLFGSGSRAGDIEECATDLKEELDRRVTSVLAALRHN